MRSLTLPERVEELAFEQNSRPESCGDLVQSDQRCVPDGLDNVVVDASHKPEEVFLLIKVGEIFTRKGLRASAIYW